MKALSRFIKKNLKSEKKTQVSLADYLGLSRQALTYKFKYNKWSLDDMRKVSAFFNISLLDLIQKSGQK